MEFKMSLTNWKMDLNKKEIKKNPELN